MGMAAALLELVSGEISEHRSAYTRNQRQQSCACSCCCMFCQQNQTESVEEGWLGKCDRTNCGQNKGNWRGNGPSCRFVLVSASGFDDLRPVFCLFIGLALWVGLFVGRAVDAFRRFVATFSFGSSRVVFVTGSGFDELRPVFCLLIGLARRVGLFFRLAARAFRRFGANLSLGSNGIPRALLSWRSALIGKYRSKPTVLAVLAASK